MRTRDSGLTLVKPPAILIMLVKIGATGVLVTCIYAVLFLVINLVWSSLVAHVFAYLAAVVIQFFILSYRVFDNGINRAVHSRRGVRYAVQISIVLLVSTAAERLLEIPPIFEAFALAIVITLINALMYFTWTFRDRPKAKN